MALGKYSKTLKIVLNVDLADENAWSKIIDSLFELRNVLMCTVCQQLVVKPVRPSLSDCHHSVCESCIERKVRMTSDCAQCGDYKNVQENIPLRLLLRSYKKMCEVILSSKFMRQWRHINLTSTMKRFLKVIHEGATYKDNFPIKRKKRNPDQSSASTSKPDTSVNELNSDDGEDEEEHVFRVIDDADADSEFPVTPKSYFNGEPGNRDSTVFMDSLVDMSDDDLDESFLKHYVKAMKKKTLCRCGYTSKSTKTRDCSNGKLACSNETCPCYAKRLPCTTCDCKGCKNPRSSDDDYTPRKTFDINDLEDISSDEMSDVDGRPDVNERSYVDEMSFVDEMLNGDEMPFADEMSDVDDMSDADDLSDIDEMSFYDEMNRYIDNTFEIL